MTAVPPPPASCTVMHEVPAPAKLNLFLHVVGQRDDGYHCLQTAFRFVSLADQLGFERRSDGKILRQGPGLAGLPAAKDLTVAAARLLQQATGTSYGANIWYSKHIPAGAGLGGGSSNAATTLLALNRLWATGLRRDELQKLGLRLGADVPVFIFGQGAFAQGVGDQLQALRYPDTYYVLIHSPASLSTADVFSYPDLTRNTKPITITDFTKWLGRAELGSHFGRNDLEPAACNMAPCVLRLQALLAGMGVAARMTGSGSSFFVPCSMAASAAMLKQEILGKISARVSVAEQVVSQVSMGHGLNDHPLKYWVNN